MNNNEKKPVSCAAMQIISHLEIEIVYTNNVATKADDRQTRI